MKKKRNQWPKNDAVSEDPGGPPKAGTGRYGPPLSTEGFAWPSSDKIPRLCDILDDDPGDIPVYLPPRRKVARDIPTPHPWEGLDPNGVTWGPEEKSRALRDALRSEKDYHAGVYSTQKNANKTHMPSELQVTDGTFAPSTKVIPMPKPDPGFSDESHIQRSWAASPMTPNELLAFTGIVGASVMFVVGVAMIIYSQLGVP